MIEIKNKQLCESCFAETDSDICPKCGFNRSEYASDPLVLPMGTRLNEDIVIGRVIGKGGFGVTYLGYDLRMNKTIAVKEYYPNGIAYRSHAGTEISVADTKSAETFKNGAEKFYAEAEMVAQFNGNPNIVSVYDYFRENNTVYLVMEYISGITLKSYVKRHGRLTGGQALFVMDKIAAALSITHSAGVLHRDISPDNIMICRDGKVKLIDFGAARQIMAESSSNLTVVLKPGYTPIEQYTKKGKQGAWTDIYSLGVSVYYALTEVIIDDPYARMEDDSELEENKHGINRDLWAILKKCTMINASERYGSAIDLRKALKSVSAPIKAEAIVLSDDDLRDSPEKAENIPITMEQTVPVEEKTEESIEVFEEGDTAEAAPDDEKAQEIITSGEKPQGTPSYKKDKGRKSTAGRIFAAAAAAVGVICIILAGMKLSGNDIFKKRVVLDSSDVEWAENKEISKSVLNKFDGDVKVVLDVECVNENKDNDGNYYHTLYVVDYNYGYVSVHAPNTGRNFGNKYTIDEKQKTFTFFVERGDIEKACDGLQFSTFNVKVNSAAVYDYDPDEYKINPKAKIIQLDSKYPGLNQNSSPIPKKELESFKGDVKVTLSIERFNDETDRYKENGNKVYWVSIRPYSGDERVYTKADNVSLWEDFSFELCYKDVPDTFTFVISRSEISKLNDEGLVFQCRNVIIKSAALEKA